MRNLLVTGSTGFIGSHFFKLYPNARAVVRRGSKFCYHDFFEIDSLNSRTEWSNAFKGIDSIIHLAGLAHSNKYSESDYYEVNVLGTAHLAREAAKHGVKRFVFVSSIGVNGSNTSGGSFSSQQQANPSNAYSRSKYEAEIKIAQISRETGMQFVIVRPTLVYGPGAPGNFGRLTRLIEMCPMLPFGLANNHRSFISVQNLVDLLVNCSLREEASSHTFLASDCEDVSIKQFTNIMAESMGKRVLQLPIPVALMRFIGKLTGKSSIVEQLYGDLSVDSSEISRVLGWTPPLSVKQSMAKLKYTSET